MFARAGFPIEPGEPVPDALVDEIMVTFHSAGDAAADFATTAAMLGKL